MADNANRLLFPTPAYAAARGSSLALESAVSAGGFRHASVHADGRPTAHSTPPFPPLHPLRAGCCLVFSRLSAPLGAEGGGEVRRRSRRRQTTVGRAVSGEEAVTALEPGLEAARDWTSRATEGPIPDSSWVTLGGGCYVCTARGGSPLTHTLGIR